MFDWFRSKAVCPVEPEAKAWIERRMIWLAEEFGWERLRFAKVVLPTPEFFPDLYSGKESDALVLLDRVCCYMGIEPEEIVPCFYKGLKPVHEQEWQQGAFRLYHKKHGKFRIWVDVSNLHDPLALVASLACDLGHVHLLGHGRLTEEAEDLEPLTNLLTVFLGLGVLTANSVIRESYWHEGHLSGWSIGCRGYLSMPMYGYAIALFAWTRNEVDPRWVKELRLDVRSAYKQAVRYLVDTRDSTFQPKPA